MKKYFFYYLFLLTVLVIPAIAQEEGKTLKVYDSQTKSYQNIPIDQSLDSLDARPPKDILENSDNMIPATIINGEDWYQVDGNKWPFSAVVYIKGVGKSCSGSMIGPYTVLTNAHCVYKSFSHNDGTLDDPSSITVFAGRKNSSISARGTRIYAAPGTNKVSWGTQFMKMDYAIIVLNKPIGNTTGMFGAKGIKVSVGNRIAVIGFPGKRSYDNPWFSPGEVTSTYQGFFYYNADALPGNSGSPVFLANDLQNLIALHSFGDDDNGRFNGATNPSSHALISFISQYQNEKPSVTDNQDNGLEQTTRENTTQEIMDILNQSTKTGKTSKENTKQNIIGIFQKSSQKDKKR